MMMTIWWSKATLLLEFSRSVNRTLQSRASACGRGGPLSVTEEKEKKKDWSWSILVVGFNSPLLLAPQSLMQFYSECLWKDWKAF